MGIMQCIDEIDDHLRKELPDHYHAHVKINSRFLGDPVSRPRLYFVGVARPGLSACKHSAGFRMFEVLDGALKENSCAQYHIEWQASEGAGSNRETGSMSGCDQVAGSARRLGTCATAHVAPQGQEGGAALPR